MTKNTHTLSNGQEIWLCTFTGEVLEQSTHSSTSVHQDAATVLSTNQVIPGQVRSEVHIHSMLWLRGSDGSELPVRMTDIGLATRAGQTLTVVWGGMAWAEEGPYFGARNHTTGEVRADILSLGTRLREWRLDIGTAASMAAWIGGTAVALGLLAFAVTGGNLENRASLALGGLLGGAMLGGIGWTLLGSHLGPGRRAKALTDEINAAAESALRASA